MAVEQVTTSLLLVIPFIVLFIVPMIKTEKKDERNFIVFSFAISLIVLLGFRDNGGADDIEVYKLYFDYGYQKEPIFNLITQLVRIIGFNYKGVFLCYSILLAIFVFLALKNCDFEKYDLLVFIAAFYFLVFPNILTVMRQALAAAMLFYLHSCKNVTWKKRFIMWGLMVCTHYAFLLLIPVEFFIVFFGEKIKTASKFLIPIVGLCIGEFVNLEELIQKITGFLGLYSYMNTEENYSLSQGLGEVIYILFVLYLIIKVLEGVSKGICGDKFKHETQIFQMLYFFFLFVTINMRWGNRIAYYFVFFVPFIVNEFIKYFNINESKKPVKFLTIVVMYVFFEYYMMTYCENAEYTFSFLFNN